MDSTKTPSQSSSNLDYDTYRAIQGLKSKHERVYSSELAGITFSYRPLTWAENQELVERSSEDPEQADIIVQKVLLDPSYDDVVDDVDAGVIEALATQIVEVSGFASVESFNEGLMWARGEIEGLQYEVVGAICKAFPAYKMEDIYDLPFMDIMIKLALAEKILGVAPEQQQGMMPVSEGMEAYGDVPNMPAPSIDQMEMIQADPRSDDLMRGGARPPDFTSDNAELTRHG